MVLKDCVRIFLFIINSITVVVGFAITAVGIYCISKSQHDPLSDMDTGSLVGFVVFTLLIGLFVLVLGLLGCFGSITQSPRMMNVYVGLILLVLVLELVALVGMLVKKAAIQKQADEGFEDLVKEYNGTSNSTDSNALDAIQANLECCGYDSPSDYSTVTPASCCSEEVANFTACPAGKAFTEGCKDKLGKFVEDVICLFGVVLAFAIILDLVSVIGAIYVKRTTPKYDTLA